MMFADNMTLLTAVTPMRTFSLCLLFSLSLSLYYCLQLIQAKYEEGFIRFCSQDIYFPVTTILPDFIKEISLQQFIYVMT